jgi:hypothetical protein
VCATTESRQLGRGPAQALPAAATEPRTSRRLPLDAHAEERRGGAMPPRLPRFADPPKGDAPHLAKAQTSPSAVLASRWPQEGRSGVGVTDRGCGLSERGRVRPLSRPASRSVR